MDKETQALRDRMQGGVPFIWSMAEKFIESDLDKKFNPNQPRDAKGRFGSYGAWYKSLPVLPAREPRIGMGDVTVSEKDLQLMKRGSLGPYIVGRTEDGQPVFTEERTQLHEYMVQEAVLGVPTVTDPTFYMLGGGTASGKTTMLKSGQITVPEGKEAVQINADDVKEHLPEYRKMVAEKNTDAAAYAHEESSYVTKRMQSAAFETSKNVVLDGTGDSSEESLGKKIISAKRAGYVVNGYYATVPTQVALQRAIDRGNKTGRAVPVVIIANNHREVSRIFPFAAKSFDTIKLFDTLDGAKLIASGAGGKLDVLDNAAYESFLAKGNE